MSKVWRRAGRLAPAPVAPLGVTETGIFNLDLIRDGPHGLIGGTTGSGKSELLRSLVAALAVYTDPEHLTFVLMDYKGGAAFDECSRLPHTVGLVTDLDEQLGERALQALEAEIHYRERALRAAGVDNLRDYQVLGLPEALPRLLVVIDEFATMAKELPEFLQALVSIAQRGRTLGVHLLLATQRPVRRRQRQHPHEHEPAHRAARAGRRRLDSTSSACATRRTSAVTSRGGRTSASARGRSCRSRRRS